MNCKKYFQQLFNYICTIILQMEIFFLQEKNQLGIQINDACKKLYQLLKSIDVETLPLEPFYKWYFNKCHLSRPIFSLQTSARLLYNAIEATGKPASNVVIMDYGAGLGTLYIIAKMIGVKKIIYNDLLPEFAMPAIEVDKFLGIVMDEYIIGDTESTCKQLNEKNIVCDVIVSRNVVEHIYNLADFFSIIHLHQPTAILYNSTTANWKNPAAHIQHLLIHKKARNATVVKKQTIITEMIANITDVEANKLAKKLVQYGGKEFYDAIKQYEVDKKFPAPKNDYSNICDETGNWGEHLLPYKKYEQYAKDYSLTFLPGFWDENYNSSIKKLMGKTLNTITKLLGKYGYRSSSFFYIVCKPR